MLSHHQPYVVVGVVPGQPPEVVTTAAAFAEQFDAELVCAFVDSSSYPIETTSVGVVAMPIDPDLTGSEVEVFDSAWREALAATLDARPVRWSVRALAGGAAHELARLADELDAAMIVVGTREAGVRGSLREFFNGSVAVHLAHRQHRPVVVVPLDPVIDGGTLPWQESAGE